MMRSPWIVSLSNTSYPKLAKNTSCDVVIVGGGIAGISSAYHILRETKFSVVILEAFKIAHGATGHNAGQVASYFERPFNDIAEEFGLKKAGEAQKNLLSSWNILRKMHRKAKVKTHLASFIGYAGFSNKKQIEEHLENKLERKKVGIVMEKVYIAKEFVKTHKINKKYRGLYSVVPKKKILSLLETSDKNFIAAFGSKKGLVNSAMFTQDVLSYLLKKYPNRIRVFEHSPVKKIELNHVGSIVFAEKRIVSKYVVLCTNGFHNFKILHKGSEIDKSFHQNVRSEIGYMAGYLEEVSKKPTAISYFKRGARKTKTGEIYFYLTRRLYHLKGKVFNLICIGGPQGYIKKNENYSRRKPFPISAKKEINGFLRNTYLHSSKDAVEYHYLWHGVMGYTKNLLRMIGPDPRCSFLLYNLGCNGVGILSSVYGGFKVGKILKGKKFEPSVFDPVFE